MSNQGKFMWPGYGENCRVLDWILRRIDNEPGTAQQTPIGIVPTRESFDARGLDVDFDGLFSVPIDFWTEEVSSGPLYSATLITFVSSGFLSITYIMLFRIFRPKK